MRRLLLAMALVAGLAAPVAGAPLFPDVPGSRDFAATLAARGVPSLGADWRIAQGTTAGLTLRDFSTTDLVPGRRGRGPRPGHRRRHRPPLRLGGPAGRHPLQDELLRA